MGLTYTGNANAAGVRDFDVKYNSTLVTVVQRERLGVQFALLL
jgi:hypothetical protein